MSIWSWLKGAKSVGDARRYAVVDVEVGRDGAAILDIGALRHDGATFHRASKSGLFDFLRGGDFLCGHNIVRHDAKYLFSDGSPRWALVDTLYVSPLLFPERPYHRLVKDDKLVCDQLNNPVNDCVKARDLLMDELGAWSSLPDALRSVYASLLWGRAEFEGFLQMVGAEPVAASRLPGLVAELLEGRVCANADIGGFVSGAPCELAYAVALIRTSDSRSVTPGWVLRNYPDVEHVMWRLRGVPCRGGCPYCASMLDVHKGLMSFFGYDAFRLYEGEPLQERAVGAAMAGKSLLAVFPTGGGKSLTFQLPALMAGRAERGLTVVVSPLLSLMKDQVDNLAKRGIVEAVTINGTLDPISRAAAMARVAEGDVSLLYIAPEMLRSVTLGRILRMRRIVRFVIDEAHCFSAWGQDFRVDYLYIGKFISQYREAKGIRDPIPVSCFTATAKQKVVQDIRDYFKRTLGLDLEIFASAAARKNLRYAVVHVESEADKYLKLRELVADARGPVIVYVARTGRTREIADKLTRDGYAALPFNGRMEPDEKVANQDAFMSDKVQVIVATSAFGMGVDKSDVGLVVHYDISDSLENYVQEAGRAGRDPSLEARCYVLYGDDDLDKHFLLLNQTKLSISEIQQVWKAVKEFTPRNNMRASCSALDIARAAGWDAAASSDLETRVRTALAALEQSGYIERGDNEPRIFATGIVVKNVEEARRRLEASKLFESGEVETAVRIIRSLISRKHTAKARDADAEARVDYLSDILGISKSVVIGVVERMRLEGILNRGQDMLVHLDAVGSKKKANDVLERFARLERHIVGSLPGEGVAQTSYELLNEGAHKAGIDTATEKDVKTLLYFLVVKRYVRKSEEAGRAICVARTASVREAERRCDRRWRICRFSIRWLYGLAPAQSAQGQPQRKGVPFSLVELFESVRTQNRSLLESLDDVTLGEVEEALLYLQHIGALRLDGGFLVLYNKLSITRTKEAKFNYKKDDYRMLDEFYRQKIQQVHIVGEYANLMVSNYDAALQYVQDYFLMDYKGFVAKYFKGEKSADIRLNMTRKRFDKLFRDLSATQAGVIDDKESHCIVVAAGPGSGKTRVLVHKLASLLLQEDVKHEQLLMLTFSRAAATEFSQRLGELIGSAAFYVAIRTFHSYAFDVVARPGSLEEAGNVVRLAADMINGGEAEPSKVGKTVLVIDEAQDMGEDEFALVEALMARNAENGMRVIAVGDDDQNIFEFRGSNSRFLARLAQMPHSRFVEMTENYRSARHVVDFANGFVKSIGARMKSSPIVSMSREDGWVELTRHASGEMVVPLVEQVVRRREGGTACVLTRTNSEAAMVVALLRRRGVNSKLIQALDGFRFWCVAEVRYMLKILKRRVTMRFIADAEWEAAKSDTFKAYDGSGCLPYLRRCLDLFERTRKAKYVTDFEEFVFESSVEDFCDVEGADVVVSTIHKSKGREFDDVFMLVPSADSSDDQRRRLLYVGMTRAKRRLFVHTDGGEFDRLPVDRVVDDTASYEPPDEVSLQLTHKDVNLGFFNGRKREVLSVRSGAPLVFNGSCLLSQDGVPVAMLSKAMMARLSSWRERGYVVVSASARFVVSWRPKGAPPGEPEVAVLLADLALSRVGRPKPAN